MTEEQIAINRLMCGNTAHSCKADYIKTAIQALEEIQQYRAIGTVEELKTMKENGSFTGLELAQLAAMQMRLKKYSEIGTVEEFKALKEKNEPKKDNNDNGRCKNCGTYNNFIINKLANPKGHLVIHCWNCGQAIDWTE